MNFRKLAKPNTLVIFKPPYCCGFEVETYLFLTEDVLLHRNQYYYFTSENNSNGSTLERTARTSNYWFQSLCGDSQLGILKILPKFASVKKSKKTIIITLPGY